MEQRMSRMEEMMADFQKSTLDFQEKFARGRIEISKQLSELMATMNRSRGDRRTERSPDDQALNDEELVETEAETKSSGIEDRAVENEANSNVISAVVKEESIPHFLMVTEADSTCVQHTNVILQQVSISPLEHSLNFCKANLDVMGKCQYAMGKTHRIWSDSTFECVKDDACQVFDVIHMRTKVLPREHKKRVHKSWRFKFKDKVQPSKLIQEQLGVHEGNATRNQLRSPSGFVVDDSHSGFGSDILCVQHLVGSVVVEDFQETQWLFNGSWLKAPYVKLETECFLEIESLQEDVQLVLLAFLHVNATEPRYAIGERDKMLEVARDVSKRSMLGLAFGIRESNAGEDQRAVCEQIIKVNAWLYQIRLVLQQVMRSKKIKFPKRWMFKYKYVEEDIKSLHNQLSYKSHLASTLAYELFHSPRPPELFVADRMVATKEEMEKDMEEDDQKQQGDWGHYFLLFAAANQSHRWSASYQVWHRWKARLFVGMISTMRAWLFGEGGFDIGNEVKEMTRGRHRSKGNQWLR